MIPCSGRLASGTEQTLTKHSVVASSRQQSCQKYSCSLANKNTTTENRMAVFLPAELKLRGASFSLVWGANSFKTFFKYQSNFRKFCSSNLRKFKSTEYRSVYGPVVKILWTVGTQHKWRCYKILGRKAVILFYSRWTQYTPNYQ